MKFFSILVILIFCSPLVAKEKVTLQLKWFHQFQFAGYYAALEQGYYDEVGLDVEIRERDRNTSPIDDVIKGKANYGISDSSIVVQRMAGKPVVIASTIFQASPLIFMSLADKGITSPYDLAGKRIMFQRSVDDAPLLALLKMFGIQATDYQFVKHNFNDESLINGTTDVMSGYRSNQPVKYKELGHEVNIIDPSSYGVDFYGDLIFTTEDEVKNHKGRVKKFVSASRLGWIYALEHQEEIADLIINKYGSKTAKPLLLQEANETANLVKHKFVELGTAFPNRFNSIAETYKDLGMVGKSSTIDGLFLSEYEFSSFKVDNRYLYLLISILIAVLAYSYHQKTFNRRLKRLVEEQTIELEQNNNKLQENLTLLEYSNRELALAKQAADKASSAKSLFLANMSHEIRTPMNGILGTLQLLKQQPQNDESSQLLSDASLSSRALLTIINDILDFSKIEAGKLSIENVPFDLNAILQSVESSLKPDIEEKGLQFNIEKKDSYLRYWSGDSVRVKQILLNIVSNAVKFTEQGAVNITLAKSVQNYLEIKISDSGIGMSDQHLHNLFSRFEQADKSTTRKFGGTGLGMAITKSLVDIMNGTIDVKSELGKGTVFTILLPLKHVEQHEIGAKHEPKLTLPKLEKLTAILAEDNKINQTIFLSMMKGTGIQIRVANNGQEAVDLVADSVPDVIFMDIQMPIMDGMEACTIIKKSHPEIKVIAVTANVMDEDIEMYFAGDFDYYLAKPIELSQLYQVCNELNNELDVR
ncbi:ABC transporter substrate-binding protein [Psychrosphaera sp. B3R10]|uniref:ABC transporter substrate-binding protein n=1 Tax=unclassified Psychrosphaera TaxID=2641570 RepID=UPI001C086F52|nr:MULTISPECIES: ABC transporter substrate-binding protein [unclassified Psychrosphaera]MBU2881702.1 ABC transporter substrate-binding protein [Psychrosphaera sp. I2R16]MBU2991043.1 ABC transporter substrate-binding protein [Psychrosphaera sp. B3R10]